MNWGVINWGIPLAEFADTYNGQPLSKLLRNKMTAGLNNLALDEYCNLAL